MERMLQRLQRACRALNGNFRLKCGLLLLILILFVAVFAPALASHDPKALGNRTISPPDAEHFLGTDDLGRDVFSMIVYGTRVSLMVGVSAALLSAVIGVVLGALAGYFGGLADKILNEINNIFLMLPSFFLVLIIIALFGSSLFNVMLVIGLTSWPSNARLMRAQAMSLRERTYIKSALVVGESRVSIVFRLIIPGGLPAVIANTTMQIGAAVLTEASLSFLGLGDPNTVSWGQMINQGRGYLLNGWWVCTFSGLAVLFLVSTFYLLGDGVTAQMNPKGRARQ